MWRASLILLIVIAMAGCGDADSDETGVAGNGDVVTETRTVDDFDDVQVDNGALVVLTVDPGTAGDSIALEVTGDSNLLEYFTTDVTGRGLRADIDGPPGGMRPTRSLQATATVAALTEASADNGGSVEVNGSVPDLSVSSDNGGIVTLDGSVGELVVTANNGGIIRGESFEATTADVDIDNGAIVDVCATGAVTGTVTNGAELTVSCGGSTSGVETANGGVVDSD